MGVRRNPRQRTPLQDAQEASVRGKQREEKERDKKRHKQKDTKKERQRGLYREEVVEKGLTCDTLQVSQWFQCQEVARPLEGLLTKLSTIIAVSINLKTLNE